VAKILLFSDVRALFSKRGYTLLSKDCIDSKVKLKYICPEGHTGSISWNSFQRGRGCSVCAKNKKLTLSYVREQFKHAGYELLSDTYTKNSDKLKVRCPEGHVGYMRYGSFQQGKRCFSCKGSKKHSYEYVKSVFELHNYKLLSKEYKNIDSKLLYECPYGHVNSMSLDKFQAGRRCPSCAGRTLPTMAEVTKLFSSCGYTLLSDSYKTKGCKLKCRCPKGHLWHISYTGFASGTRCPECAGNKRHTLTDVRSYFSEYGYKILSTKYLNSKQLLVYECPKGHIGKISHSNFKKGHRCAKCSGNKKLTLVFIKSIFEEAGYTVLSDTYVSAHTPIVYSCPVGHRGRITYNSFKRGSRCPICSGGPVSKISQTWLDQKDKLHLFPLFREHTLRVGGKKYKVDGYDPLTRTVYEFLGDYYHGNPTRFKLEDMNSKLKKSYGQLHKETFERLAILEAEGYKVVYIWEKDFSEQQKSLKG
jgi:hypothetical protein